MRHFLLTTVFAAVLTGCPKPVYQQASTNATVALACPIEGVEGPVIAPPERLVTLLSNELSLRNLTPDPVADQTLQGQRGAPARIALLGGEIGLLVASTARFSSQINGRYRWTVSVEASLVDGAADSGRTLVSRTFVVPVHLIYYHQQESAALAEAAPVIARTVGQLLDDWIANTP